MKHVEAVANKDISAQDLQVNSEKLYTELKKPLKNIIKRLEIDKDYLEKRITIKVERLALTKLKRANAAQQEAIISLTVNKFMLDHDDLVKKDAARKAQAAKDKEVAEVLEPGMTIGGIPVMNPKGPKQEDGEEITPDEKPGVEVDATGEIKENQ